MLICLTCLNRFISLTYASFVREMNYLKFSKICGENVEYSFRSHKGEKKTIILNVHTHLILGLSINFKPWCYDNHIP